jgi:regulator of RNase E activity RraA
MGSLGFRIYPAAAQIAPEILQAFADIPVAHVSDSMSHLYGVFGLRKYHRAGRLVGSAFTVKTRPGDSLMVHKALELARAGDVLVIDGGGYIIQAIAGELMLLYARQKHMAGFVVDGAIRDVAAYMAGDFPCYARAHTYLGPYKDGPGEINVPVSIGGLVVNPGDLVLGDDDGVLAFPPTLVPELLESARALGLSEKARQAAIVENRDEKSWVDDILRAKGLDL